MFKGRVACACSLCTPLRAIQTSQESFLRRLSLSTCQRNLVLIAAVAALSGCGLDAEGSAATGAAVKKQELDQAQAQRDAVQRQLDQSQQ